ncbi:MAG TPA: helix-turn-helix domain-containing protein [Steroidobacteraceae bacterium]|jgi:excisionase family DNA binding protein|nr:helix-turn-helix domain-containing protein [Steroidobacteraceae bacterium]
MDSEFALFSLEQVALRLGLNVRTVRGYVRSGRLKAIRIGKQYRVAREDLETITGRSGPHGIIARHRQGEVSSVIQIDAVSEYMASRISEHLRSAVEKARAEASALRIETIHDKGRAQLKLIVIGSLSAAAGVFTLLDAILDA